MPAREITLRLLYQLRQHRLQRWEWIALALVGATILLLLLLPGLLRRQIATRLAMVTTMEVRLADVDFNPFRGRLILKRLTLTLSGKEHPVIAVRELVFNLRLLSLLRGRVSLEEVHLSGPRVEVVRQTDGQLNLGRLFPQQPPSGTAPAKSDLPTPTIERFGLSAGKIRYRDLTRTPPALFTLVVKELTADEIGLQPQGLDTPIAVRLDGTLEGSPLRGEARISWQREHTAVEAEIDIQRLALVTIAPYLRDALTLQQLSGHVGVRLHYRYHSGGAQPPVHTLDGALKLERVLFADPISGQTALNLPTGQVTVEKVDLHSREIRLATVELHNPKLFFFQTPTGINWAALVRTPDQAVQTEVLQSAAEPAWRFSLQDARLTGGEIVYRNHTWAETEAITLAPEEIQVQNLGGEADESPFHFRARLGGGTVAGEGHLRLSPFSIHVQVQPTGVDLTTLRPLLTRALAVESVRGKVSGTVRAQLAPRNGTQAASVSGALDMVALALDGIPEPGSALEWESSHVELHEGSTIVPLDLGLNVQLARFSIQRPAPEHLSIEQVSGNLRLTQEQRGRRNVRLSENLPTSESSDEQSSSAEPGDSSPGRTPALLAQGVVEITNLALTHAPEQQILLGCYQIRAELSEGSRLLPLDLRLQDVVLEYPYVQVLRTAAGSFQLFSPALSLGGQAPVSTPTQEPAVTEQPSPAVHIDRATVRGGEVSFADHTLTPPHTVHWQDVRLDLSNVGYPPPLAAVFALHALNEDGAPIQLRGTMERQGEQTLVRVRGEVERLSLPRFNSYLVPHIGYPIRNGALSLNFDLVIPGDRLQANAKVTLHDLGLGSMQGASLLEKQVGLPLSLVIALLKDLNGNINLQLPVEGRVGEPGFRLGGTILRATRDALISAVTSPLKLLGAVFIRKGTIQDFTLEPIRFVPGTSQLSSSGKEQLTRLGSFLSQRPELDLRLSGHTGPDDMRALGDRLVLAQLQGDAPPPAGVQNTPGPKQEGVAPQVTPQDEVRQFLAHQLGQPGSGGAPALSAQAAALLAQLRDQAVVSSQAIDRLAQERVQAVMTDLTTSYSVASARLHLAPGKLRSREGAEVRYLIQAREK